LKAKTSKPKKLLSVLTKAQIEKHPQDKQSGLESLDSPRLLNLAYSGCKNQEYLEKAVEALNFLRSQRCIKLSLFFAAFLPFLHFFFLPCFHSHLRRCLLFPDDILLLMLIINPRPPRRSC
jgi:hypothetical protein